MQLGTRWVSGDPLPVAVPASLHAAIAEVDSAATADAYGRPRWTLTFLEGRPIVELDTGMIVSLAADGSVSVRRDDDDALS